MKPLKTKVGIIGAAGYTGGELIRLLINHPNIEIAFAQSNSCAGRKVVDVHTDLFGETELIFSFSKLMEIEILFLCSSHGEAKEFLTTNKISAHTKIIDLSQDFRLNENHTINNYEFVYGLPELNKIKIMQTNAVANPGCFATVIQLAILPLAKKKILTEDIHINATTGSTGAGQGLIGTSHFSWRQNNHSTYKVFDHQHLNEIRESVGQLQPNCKTKINFIPQRGTFTRGIFCSVYTPCKLSELEIRNLFLEYYAEHPFVFVSEKEIDLKQVVNTNKCILHIEKRDEKIVITAVIDNLLKGASGQAVQNMNLMMGWEETVGLKLKALAF